MKRGSSPPSIIAARYSSEASGEERGVDLEVGVFRGRPDQRDEPLLHSRQERVLLGLVEAMDLVEEEDRRLTARSEAVVGPLEDLAHLGPAGVDSRDLLERG